MFEWCQRYLEVTKDDHTHLLHKTSEYYRAAPPNFCQSLRLMVQLLHGARHYKTANDNESPTTLWIVVLARYYSKSLHYLISEFVLLQFSVLLLQLYILYQQEQLKKSSVLLVQLIRSESAIRFIQMKDPIQVRTSKS